AKVVEEEERIELGRIAEAERALQLDAGAFDRRPRTYHPLDRSNGHCGAPVPLYLLDASHTSTGRAGWRLACTLPPSTRINEGGMMKRVSTLLAYGFGCVAIAAAQTAHPPTSGSDQTSAYKSTDNTITVIGCLQ